MEFQDIIPQEKQSCQQHNHVRGMQRHNTNEASNTKLISSFLQVLLKFRHKPFVLREYVINTNIDPSVECVMDLIHKPFILRGCVIDPMIDQLSIQNVVPDSVLTSIPTIVPKMESNTSIILSIEYHTRLCPDNWFKLETQFLFVVSL